MPPTRPRHGCFLLLAVLLAAVCLAAQEQPGQSSSKLPEAERQQVPELSQGPLPVFEFHSGFWVNLHHILYQQARAHRTPAPREAGASVAPAALTAEEQKAWTTALNYYAEHLANRDLLFNGDMVLINDRLAEMETCADLSGRSAAVCASGLRPELIAALEGAAPVYRARWWAEQDRLNRAWITAVTPLVRQMGGRLAQQLAGVYHAGWPAARLRVDVVFYAGPFGAYTTLDPVHLTISSADARNQGPAALEILLHEASHALAGSVRDAIVRECRRLGKPIPRDLWHALLFYTTGEIVKRALASPEPGASAPAKAAAAPATSSGSSAPGQPARSPADSSDYMPYAYRYGLYARGWQNYQRMLERYWQPYLDGKTEFETAVTRLVSAL